MQARSITYVNNDNDLKYIKKHKFNLFGNIIIGPSNIIDKVINDNELYKQLIVQQNRFAINNYKEEK